MALSSSGSPRPDVADYHGFRPPEPAHTYPPAQPPTVVASVAMRRPKAKRVCARCKVCKTVCDDARPCQRCIRLGVADTCVDAEPRGRAKQASRAGKASAADAAAAVKGKAGRSPPKAEPTALTHAATWSYGDALAAADPGLTAGLASAQPFADAAASDPLLASTEAQGAGLWLESMLGSAGLYGGSDAGSSTSSSTSSSSGGMGMVGTMVGSLVSSIGSAATSLFGPSVVNTAASAFFGQLDHARLHALYFENMMRELEEWHERIVNGLADYSIPMYLLCYRHCMEMCAKYKYLGEAEMEAEKVRLLSGVPINESHRQLLEDRPLRSVSDAEDVGERAKQLVYEKLPIGIAKFANDNFTLMPTYCNAQAEAMFGLKLSEVLANGAGSMLLARVVHPDYYRSLMLALISSTVNRQEVFQFKCRCFHTSGSTLDVVLTVQLDFTNGPIPSGGTVYIQRL